MKLLTTIAFIMLASTNAAHALIVNIQSAYDNDLFCYSGRGDKDIIVYRFTEDDLSVVTRLKDNSSWVFDADMVDYDWSYIESEDKEYTSTSGEKWKVSYNIDRINGEFNLKFYYYSDYYKDWRYHNTYKYTCNKKKPTRKF